MKIGNNWNVLGLIYYYMPFIAFLAFGSLELFVYTIDFSYM